MNEIRIKNKFRHFCYFSPIFGVFSFFRGRIIFFFKHDFCCNLYSILLKFQEAVLYQKVQTIESHFFWIGSFFSILGYIEEKKISVPRKYRKKASRALEKHLYLGEKIFACLYFGLSLPYVYMNYVQKFQPQQSKWL